MGDTIENKILNDLKIQATVHLDPVLPDITNQDQVKQIISRFIKEEDVLLNYRELRFIGEESHATLVFDLISKIALNEEAYEDLNRRIKEKITGYLPAIKDVRINFIPQSV